MGVNAWVLIGAAVLGSSVLTRLVEKFFSKKHDEAVLVKTRAESKDIVVRAADTAVSLMERNMQQMARAMEENTRKLEELAERVELLESTVRAYHRAYGPMEGHEIDWGNL